MKNKNRNQNKKIRKTGIGIGISIIKNWFITGNKKIKKRRRRRTRNLVTCSGRRKFECEEFDSRVSYIFMLRENFLLSPSDPWLWPGLFKCRPFQVKSSIEAQGFELAARKWD